MVILILGSVLLGAILGRFFKVLVLVLAYAFVLAVVLVRSADGEHGLLRPLLEFAVLITSLQIGYVFGLVSHSIPSVSERRERRPRRQPAPRANIPYDIASSLQPQCPARSRRKTQHSARSFKVR